MIKHEVQRPNSMDHLRPSMFSIVSLDWIIDATEEYLQVVSIKGFTKYCLKSHLNPTRPGIYLWWTAYNLIQIIRLQKFLVLSWSKEQWIPCISISCLAACSLCSIGNLQVKHDFHKQMCFAKVSSAWPCLTVFFIRLVKARCQNRQTHVEEEVCSVRDHTICTWELNISQWKIHFCIGSWLWFQVLLWGMLF